MIDMVVDPSLDVRARVAASSGIFESPDKIWFHRTAAAVIDAGRCVRCGTCIAACPSNSISVATDGLPTLVRMCTGCSSCWDFCPLAGMRTEGLLRRWAEANGSGANGANGHSNGSNGHHDESNGLGAPLPVACPAAPVGDGEGLGTVLAAYEARARERRPGEQDGGVVTALLGALLEQGYLQGALLSRKQGPLSGETILATTPEQVQQGAGSVYDQTHPLSKLAQGLPAGVDEIALVGTPCQVAGARALQLFPWRYRKVPADRVKLAIALFCTRSFDAQRLTLELVRQGVNLGRVARVDIREGRFRAYDAAGEIIFETEVRALRRAALRGCDECADFTGALADIAVGNAGSRRGWTTVLIRTPRGLEAWQHAAEALEARPLADLAAVATLEARNRARAARASRRGGLNGRLWVRYSEHLQAYQGTDRAPVAPPPHRSHHYTVAC
ncbi:MAG: Coenzyme F420 hydrogenase/dehydrogenase, beta subunit C-terminal domain [Chloroflexi bacterium]|nr:Coenzyme F420 hydrogenase/dehydrogenase, beta subunit C-terminal domain [Chloroflexota bacterium]